MRVCDPSPWAARGEAYAVRECLLILSCVCDKPGNEYLIGWPTSRFSWRSSVAPTTSYGTKVILLDTSDRVHTANIRAQTDQLDTNLSTLLNDLVLVISPLPWSRVWVELDVRRDELFASC